MIDSEEKAKEWLESEGIEVTEHRIKTLADLLNKPKIVLVHEPMYPEMERYNPLKR